MTPPRAGLLIVAIVTAVFVGALVAAFARWTITDPALRATVIGDIHRASGLDLTIDGAISVRLLPRPSIDIAHVSIQGLQGAIKLDADAMTGQLALVPLLAGRIDVTGTSFANPTAAVDLDRLQPLLEAVVSEAGPSPLLRLMHTAGVTLRSGVIRLTSSDRRRDTVLTDVTATFEWPADGAEASLTGVATWRGVPGVLVVDVDHPGDVQAGRDSLASLRLKSAALDLDAVGTLSGSGEKRVWGKLTASTLDLPAFLRTIGMPAPQLGDLRQARLSSTATVAGDTLSLDEVALTLDDMLFDGAIAIRQRGDRTSLAGTLATDHIDLDCFAGALPTLLAHDGGWSSTILDTRSVANDDIDLRISATTARLGAFSIEDGSLSLQSGDGRMEMSLGEARAYDGLLKGRVVATLVGDATDVRADATLSRLDLAPLLADGFGMDGATGILSGHVALESRGTTPAGLMQGLHGKGEVAVRNGEVGGKLVTSLVRAAPSANQPSLSLDTGSGAFDAAAMDVRIDDGLATIADGWIAWPSSRGGVFGSASLLAQNLDLKVALSNLDAADPETVYDVKGPWRDLQVDTARPHL